MTFGNKLRSFRNIYNITQDEIADAMGVERSTYSYYETGRTPPTMEHARIISKIFLVPLDYLLENTVLADSSQAAIANPDAPKTNDDPIAKVLQLDSEKPTREDVVFSTQKAHPPTYLLVSDRIKDEINGLHPTIVKYNDEVFELNRLEKEVLVKLRLMEAIYHNKCNGEFSKQSTNPFAAYIEAMKATSDRLSDSSGEDTVLTESLIRDSGEPCTCEVPLYMQDSGMDSPDVSDILHMTADDWIRIIGDDIEK